MERGRKVYNFRCYVCHAYRGTGDTLVAHVLTPRPRNFTDPKEMEGINNPRMFNSIKFGVSGTAMPPFNQTIRDRDILDVIAFIRYAFMEKRFLNIQYHSPENGWDDFQSKYPEAIKFFLHDGDDKNVPEKLRLGKKIYEQSCVTCHLVKKNFSESIFIKEKR